MFTQIFDQFNAFLLKVLISLKKERKKLDPTIKWIILYKVPVKTTSSL